MRKILMLIICCVIMLVSSCGAPLASETATPSPTKESKSVSVERPGGYSQVLSGALAKSAEDIKTASDGQMAVLISDSAQEKSAAQAINGIKLGGSSILILDALDVADTVKELSVINIPMLFSSQQQCNSVLRQSFIKLIQPYFNNAGLELLGVYCSSMRNLTSSKAILTSADIKSLRIRTNDSDCDQLFWKTAGCFPTYLEPYNVYVALKQQMLEAQECTDEKIDEYKLNEVQQYMIKTGHLPDIKLILMNKASFDALSSQESGWVREFAAKSAQYAAEAQADVDTQLEQQFQSSGMFIIKSGDELNTALKTYTQPVIDLVKTKVAPEFADSYIAACQPNQTS